MNRAVAFVGALLLATAASGEAPRAAGGVRIFAALEEAPASVVAVVGAPRRVDAEAWTAELTVEQGLSGSLERGQAVAVVWEERVPRPVRFAAGDRVLVSLEGLPAGSIWRHRFPDWEERSRLSWVAHSGGAFVREPSPGSVTILEHYLALPADLRPRNAGVGYLVRLAEGAQPTLARSAVERLDRVPNLDRELDPTSARRLVAALLRSDPEEPVPAGVLALIGDRKLESVRPPLEGLIGAEPLAPAIAFRALGRLDGQLSPDVAARLLQPEHDAAHRAVGARYASGPSEQRLPQVMRRDPSPKVRAAAVTRWVESRGPEGVDRALDAFADPEPEVQGAAAAAIGGLGPDAVPALREVIDTGPPHAALAAVAALRVAGGSEAYAALVDIAANHPDEGVRLLARSAVGQPIGHVD